MGDQPLKISGIAGFQAEAEALFGAAKVAIGKTQAGHDVYTIDIRGKRAGKGDVIRLVALKIESLKQKVAAHAAGQTQLTPEKLQEYQAKLKAAVPFLEKARGLETHTAGWEKWAIKAARAFGNFILLPIHLLRGAFWIGTKGADGITALHKRSTFDKDVRNAETSLKETLTSKDPKGKSFKEAYTEQQQTLLGKGNQLDRLLKRTNNCLKLCWRSLRGTSEQGSNDLLVLALKNKKVEDATFIIKQGLFKEVSTDLIKEICSLDYLPEKDKQLLMRTLFKKAGTANEMDHVISYLMSTGRSGLACTFVAQGIKKIATDLASPQEGVRKKAELQQLHLGMMAAKLGDEALFNQAWSGGLDPLPEDASIAAKGARQTLIENNIKKHAHATIPHSGQNMLHFACQGNNDAIVDLVGRIQGAENKKHLESFEKLKPQLKGADGLGQIPKLKELAVMLNMGSIAKKCDELQKHKDEKMLSPADLEKFKENLISKMDQCAKEAQNPFLRPDKKGVKPAFLMSMELANKMDDRHGLDGNKKGSFSNLVAYCALLNKRATVLRYLGMALLGKFLGAGVATMAALGIHGMGTLATALALNVPVYAGAISGVAAASLLQKLLNRRTARLLNIEPTLTQYERKLEGKPPAPPFEAAAKEGSSKPLSLSQQMNKALKERDLQGIVDLLKNDNGNKIKVTKRLLKGLAGVHHFPAIADISKDPGTRLWVLQKLSDRCNDNPMQLELLMEGQLEGGAPGKDAAKGLIAHNLAQPALSAQQLKTCLVAAVKLGDAAPVKIIVDRAKKMGIKGRALWVDTHATAGKHKGDTLLHLACHSENIDIVLLVAKELSSATKGEKIKYKVPSATIRNRILSGKKLGASLGTNVFDMVNGKGEKVQDLLSRHMANQLDDALHFNPTESGSFSQLVASREAKGKWLLGAEVSLALPAKYTLNISVSHFIDAAILTASAVGNAHAPGLGFLAAWATEYVLGTSVMIMGLGIGIITGKGVGPALHTIDRIMKGYDDTLVQLGGDQKEVQNRIKTAILRRELNDNPARAKAMKPILKASFNDALDILGTQRLVVEPDLSKAREQMEAVLICDISTEEASRKMSAIVEKMALPQTSKALFAKQLMSGFIVHLSNAPLAAAAG